MTKILPTEMRPKKIETAKVLSTQFLNRRDYHSKVLLERKNGHLIETNKKSSMHNLNGLSHKHKLKVCNLL